MISRLRALLLMLTVGALLSVAIGQTKPAPNADEDAVLSLAADFNAFLVAGEADKIQALMFVPGRDYNRRGMFRYMEWVASGKYNSWSMNVLHAEVEGDFAVSVISQQPPVGDPEMTPLAIFKPDARWRILPYDLRLDHPEIGGQDAGTVYVTLLKRTEHWIHENTDVPDDREATSKPANTK